MRVEIDRLLPIARVVVHEHPVLVAVPQRDVDRYSLPQACNDAGTLIVAQRLITSGTAPR